MLNLTPTTTGVVIFGVCGSFSYSELTIMVVLKLPAGCPKEVFLEHHLVVCSIALFLVHP